MSSLKMCGLFVDIGNLYYCIGKKFLTKNKLDYAQYMAFAAGDHAVYCAKAFGTEISSEAVKFKTCLRHYGWEPIYKSVRVNENPKTGAKEFRKTSWNVGIAMEVVRHIEKLDIVIIGSSDAELVPMVDWVRQQGRECVVVACGISKELKAAASSFLEITEQLLSDATPTETTQQL